MQAIRWLSSVWIFFAIGCAASERSGVVASVNRGSTSFEIYAGTDEVVGATLTVAESLGLVVVPEDSEAQSLQLVSSEGSPLFRVSFEARGRLVRVVTSYDRVYPGVRVRGDESSLLAQQMNEISDAIRDILVSLPPASEVDPRDRIPASA